MSINKKALAIGTLLILAAALSVFLLRPQPETAPPAPVAATPAPAAPVAATPSAVAASTPSAVEPPADSTVKSEAQARIADLLMINKDVIGWIVIPNTKINYPVVKSRNNDYYLHRDLNRKNSEPGTLFMDYRNTGDTNDRYAVIYGHNMKNGSMFGTLKKYKKQDFYEANRTFTYSTPSGDTKWEIFAAYIAPATLELIQTDFADDAAFMDYVNTRQSKSMYAKDVELKPTDKILTLITCTYEMNNARFVVHARKVE